MGGAPPGGGDPPIVGVERNVDAGGGEDGGGERRRVILGVAMRTRGEKKTKKKTEKEGIEEVSTSAAVATRAGGDGGTERGWAARAAARAEPSQTGAEPSQTGAKPHRANRLHGQTVMGVKIETAVTPRPRLGRRGGLGGRRARRARASDAAGWWATVHRTCRHPKSEATRDVVNPNASMARTPTDRDGRRRRRESELPTALSPRL